MKQLLAWFCVLAVALAKLGATRAQEPLLTPDDFIIAIDLDGLVSFSSYPAAESPANILDGDPSTKYLNFAGPNTGFIVTPQISGTVLQSFQLTTANDAPGRDPTSYQLFGTNESITSTDNSDGMAEDWTFIAAGPLLLPDDRLTVGPVVPISNSTAYDSYRFSFPLLKEGPLMQIADVAFFESSDGSGSSILAPGDDILAVHLGAPDSRYPANERPALAIDGDAETKYLNFGRENSGFIATPSVGPTIVSGFEITTANDFPARDPAAWELYATNDPIASTDNSSGMSEDWVLIDSGTVALPDERFTVGPLVPVSGGDTFYSSYRFVVTEIRDAEAQGADSVQFANIQFYGQIIPEPSSVVLVAMGGIGVFLLGFRRRGEVSGR